MKHARIKPTSNIGRARQPRWLLAYAGLTVAWLGTSVLSISADVSTTAARYNLSSAQIHLVQLAFALPGLLILLAILFAGISILRYARAIAGSREAAGFRLVAYGILVLLVGLVAGNYLGSIQQLAAQNAANPQHVKTVFVIIANYVSVICALATYGLLFRGSQLLLRSIGRQLVAVRWIIPVAGAFGVLTAVYLWLIHDNAVSRASSNPDITPTFGLPYWLTVLTVALPFVVSWFVGVIALMGLYQYRTQAAGIIYRLLFKKFVIGMTIFIGLTILLQLVAQLSFIYSTRSVSAALGIITLLYIVLAVGAMLMAQGARKLNTIENLLIE